MKSRSLFWAFLVFAFVPNVAAAEDCAVTASRGMYGNDALDVVLPADGKFVFRPGGPGFIDDRDGALGMKVGWGLKIPGQLELTGRRLDGQAPPARAYTSYRHTVGGMSTFVVFPTPGCWEIVASVGQQSLTFVVAVELIDSGPAGRLNGVPQGWRQTGG